MLTYNTQLEKLQLPVYGRNLQRMVDHCLTIEDREERNACARTIVAAMTRLFPELKQPENAHKVWDHLAIMSGFRLDIDYPQEVVQAESLQTPPDPVPYDQHPIRLRHYGKIIEQMIQKAAGMPEGEERDALVMLLADQLKKQMLMMHPDGTDDRRVLADLAMLSHGAIRLDPETTRLHEFQMPAAPTGKKKKKKR